MLVTVTNYDVFILWVEMMHHPDGGASNCRHQVLTLLYSPQWPGVGDSRPQGGTLQPFDEKVHFRDQASMRQQSKAVQQAGKSSRQHIARGAHIDSMNGSA